MQKNLSIRFKYADGSRAYLEEWDFGAGGYSGFCASPDPKDAWKYNHAQMALILSNVLSWTAEEQDEEPCFQIVSVEVIPSEAA